MARYLRLYDLAERERQAELTPRQRTRERRKRANDRSEHSQCRGKVVWPTWTAANQAAKRTMRHISHPQQPYACRHCHKFHVGAPTETTR